MTTGRLGRFSEQAGPQRAVNAEPGLETLDAEADPPRRRGRLPAVGKMREYQMDETLLKVLGELGRVVVAATVVERVLAFVFEHEWFVRLFSKPSETDPNQRVSKLPGLKGLIALAMSVGISFSYRVDILHVVFSTHAETPAGMLLTGFLIAGGSAGAIAVFQAYLDFDKKSRDALIAAGEAEADARIRIAEANAQAAEANAQAAGAQG